MKTFTMKYRKALRSLWVLLGCALTFFALGGDQAFAHYNVAAFWKNGHLISIYRSVGAGNTSALATGASNAVTISGTTATFAGALPANIGIGDAIQYQVSSTWYIAFISGVTSSTVYTVQNNLGATPTATSSNTGWTMYRAYTILQNAVVAGLPNASINSNVAGFDNWSYGLNLVLLNKQWNIVLYNDGGTDTTAVYIQNNWITSAVNNLSIFSPTLPTQVGVSQRHWGSWASGGYTLSVTGNYAFNIQANNVKVQGMKIQVTNGATGTDPVEIENLGAGGTVYFSNNITRLSGTPWGSSQDFFTTTSNNNSAAKIYIYDNITFTDSSYNSTFGERNCYYINGGTVYLYNNTCYVPPAGGSTNGGIQIGASTTSALVKNNLMQGCAGGGGACYAGTFAAGSNYNLSSDTTTTGGANDVPSAAPQFMDVLNNDLRLASTDTVAKDAGTNLSSDPYLAFNYDIFGTTPRLIGTAWDIGASESRTAIFRSVGVNTSMLACGTTAGGCTGQGNMTISGSTATFAANVVNNIGVGDAVVYSASSLGSGDRLAFISGRTDSQHYTVKDKNGNAPTAYSAGGVWAIYRPYNSLDGGFRGGQYNGNLPADVVPFDTQSYTVNYDTGAANQQWNVACYADGTDSNTLYFNNMYTNDMSYVRIYAPYLSTDVGVSQRHHGEWAPSTTAYTLATTTGDAFTSYVDFLRVDGLQLASADSTSGTAVIYLARTTTGVGTQILSNNIAVAQYPTNFHNIFEHYESSAAYTGSVILYNNIAYNAGTSTLVCGFQFNSPGITTYAYNNTLINGLGNTWPGFVTYAGPVWAQNNISQTASGATDYEGITGNYNIASGTSTTGGAQDSAGATVKFAGPYFLNGADTVALNTGTNLSSDPHFAFTTDAHGSARGATWSRGALGMEAWTWVAGSNTANQSGSYGTLGTAYPAATHYPGGRQRPASWTDSSGNFWLYGGLGYDGTGAGPNYLNDLWEYIPSAGTWTWVSGASTVNKPGVYGTKGTAYAATSDYPGGRYSGNVWVDASGNFWIFGGFGCDSTATCTTGTSDGYLSDLWEYNPVGKTWTWWSGSNSHNIAPTLGTLGTACNAETVCWPGGRDEATSWTDSSGNFWLFGGNGVGSNGTDYLNDLWKFVPNGSSSTWTWVAGASTIDQAGSYGTEGTAYAMATHYPGAHAGSSNWSDTSGNLWFIGGHNASGTYNDVWEFTPTGSTWTWVAGLSSTYGTPTFGTQGIGSTSNIPGSGKGYDAWTDPGGNIWMFPGKGYNTSSSYGYFNDLWNFNPVSLTWTWVTGAGNTQNSSGTYGTMGTPAAANTPGARDTAAHWIDKNGVIWLWGGYGYDSVGTLGQNNDLWKYSP